MPPLGALAAPANRALITSSGTGFGRNALIDLRVATASETFTSRVCQSTVDVSEPADRRRRCRTTSIRTLMASAVPKAMRKASVWLSEKVLPKMLPRTA